MTRHRGEAARRGRATAFAAAGLAAAALSVAAVAALAVPAVALAGKAGTGGAVAAPEPGADTPAARVPAPLGPVPAGVAVRPAAVVRSLRCISGCADARTPLTGARLRVRGRNLARTDVVVFLGADGDADDVAARPLRRKRTAIDVRVPLGAAPGPVTVADRDGTRPAPARAPLALAPGNAVAPVGILAAGTRVEAQVAGPRGFFDAAVPPHVTYLLHGTEPAAVTVEIVRAADGAVVASWPAGTIAPETPQSAGWDGMAGGRPAKPGRYAFRVLTAADGPPTAAASQSLPADPTAFTLLGNVFPVRGPHGYGGAIARFGGRRHHQGQDVFAACGTPLVAARGGVVKHKRFQSAAGNYLVIDGERTRTDYAYMHLREPALVSEGDRVRTGQPIGYVGDTGHAEGCHLHLELWSAPGWYSGGAPIDPLPHLLGWDRRS